MREAARRLDTLNVTAEWEGPLLIAKPPLVDDETEPKAVKAVVLNQGDYASPGDKQQCLETVLVTRLLESCDASWTEHRDAAKSRSRRPTMAESYLSPNVNSAEVKKPSVKEFAQFKEGHTTD